MENNGKLNPEGSAMPQMVVKIVGGKHIKRFIDPNRPLDQPMPFQTHSVEYFSQWKERTLRENEEPRAAIRAGDGVKKTSAQKLELHSSNHTEYAMLHAALTQAPDRVCVTAPCGDRSRSYIHLRRAAAKTTTPAPRRQEVNSAQSEDWLLLAASEELDGWDLHTLEQIRAEMKTLDPAHTGSIHQSELTYLFLRWEVPLRLPTLAALLQVFCSSAHPEQVLYTELLQFLQKVPQNQELQNTVADIWKASPEMGEEGELGSVWSEGALSIDSGEMEPWLQRFQKMESALQLCDSQNTGFLEKEQAKRLIQNYSQIFDLNLSPLRINEVMRKAQLRDRVHLTTALRLLKGR
ncbi:uncharacterized protein C1orf87 homolog [Hoplias malabaricus]|uniref:uncharacterized protein C1orf87 homolog n=1 Tax=Hoplias malabaricus TaxID=27720 RepID=UPI00346322B3